MKFVMWWKSRDGQFTLQSWSSNASAVEQRIRSEWNSNLKGIATQSNLITVNDEDEYVFNKEVADSLIQTALEWARDPNSVTNEELAIWLANFGIIISDQTYDDLRKGKFKNKGRRTWAELFTHSAGLIRVLRTQLSKLHLDEKSPTVIDENNSLLNDTAVKQLSKLQGSNSINSYSNSFNAGGKTIYSYGNNTFLVNRMRDIAAFNEDTEEFVNSELIEGLKEIGFTKDSLWLDDIQHDVTGPIARRHFGVSYVSLEALKKIYTKSKDDRKLSNVTAAEHEVGKIGHYFNIAEEIINGERRRKVSFFYQTMADKTTMMLINALSHEVKLNNDGGLTRKNLELLYDALVLPEITRMVEYNARDKETPAAGYEPNYFYFLHALNELNIDFKGKQKNLLDLIKDDPSNLEGKDGDIIKNAIITEINSSFEQLIENKLKDWKKLGIGQEVKKDGKIVEKNSFLDKAYMKNVKGSNKVKYAAMDYVFNSLIANAEMHKLIIGDPALYAVFKKDNTLKENLEATFTNIGKRLAGDIAPGLELANSADNEYYQVFLADKEMDSINLKDKEKKEYFTKIDPHYKNGYKDIQGSDAQEYTTWKEHLYVLKQLGRLTDKQYKTIFNKLKNRKKLGDKELGLVFQPMKPVYVGNVLSVKDNIDRRV